MSCAWWTGYRAPPLRPVLPRRRRDLSSFPCFPLTACPGSQPRWIPIGTCRSPLGLLPSRPLALSALPEPPRTRFRGLSPRPAVSFSLCFAHPVATVHSGSLPSRRQGFGRVDSPTLVGSHGEAFARFLVCLRHDVPPARATRHDSGRVPPRPTAETMAAANPVSRKDPHSRRRRPTALVVRSAPAPAELPSPSPVP